MNRTAPSTLLLRKVDAFHDLPEAELIRLASHMRMMDFPKKSIIVRQGEDSRHIYFLISGYVKVARGGNLSQLEDTADRRNRPRQEIALAILGPGHMVGELAALANAPRSASVVALCDCSLIWIDYASLLECFQRNSIAAINVMSYMAKRIIEANHQVELLRSQTESRVIGMLRHFRAIGLPEDLYPSTAELGRMVGASREMVSRIRQQMKSGVPLPEGLPDDLE